MYWQVDMLLKLEIVDMLVIPVLRVAQLGRFVRVAQQ